LLVNYLCLFTAAHRYGEKKSDINKKNEPSTKAGTKNNKNNYVFKLYMHDSPMLVEQEKLWETLVLKCFIFIKFKIDFDDSYFLISNMSSCFHFIFLVDLLDVSSFGPCGYYSLILVDDTVQIISK